MDFAVTGLGGNTSSLASKRPQSKARAPQSGIFKSVKHVEPTLFGKYYDRGDIPVKVSFHGASRKVDWLVQNIELLDYHHYLPLFFQGLRQTREPYQFLADRGLDDLLAHGQKRILTVLPQLILPIKKGLNTKNADVICRILKKLQLLVQSGDFIAESLVPYYRQILPVFNLLKNKRINTGDKIDYGQRKERDIGEMIQDTLQLFEKHGGEDAYINIKYMIPTYESCMF